MSSIGSAIRHRLVNDATVSALVATRVYPQVLPQSPTLPAVVYNVLSDTPSDDISGNAGLFKAEIQFDCFATTQLAAEALDEKIRLSLQGYRGTHLSVEIRGIYFNLGLDNFEAEVLNYRKISRYEVWYRRENPDHA